VSRRLRVRQHGHVVPQQQTGGAALQEAPRQRAGRGSRFKGGFFCQTLVLILLLLVGAISAMPVLEWQGTPPVGGSFRSAAEQ
jgi:hypothetical protein